MAEPNPGSTEVSTAVRPVGQPRDRMPLRFRLLLTVVFGCFAALFGGMALSDGPEVMTRAQLGAVGLASALAVIGLWGPLGRWAGHVAEALRNLS